MADTTCTADVFDEYHERGDRLDFCELQLQQYGGRACFSGTIVTVRCLPL